MSRPIVGENYTVVDGDTLSKIAEVVYGDPSQWPTIYNANLTNLKTGDQNLIFPGEVIFIPELAVIRDIKESLIKGPSNELGFRIEIENRKLEIVSGTILRTMDTAADAWTAVIAWTPGEDKFVDRVTSPYSFVKSKAYIDSKLMVTGPLFIVKQSLDSNGSSKLLTGYSATASIVDSNMRPDQYESNNVTLKERAEDLLKPYSLRVFSENGARVDEKLSRATSTQSQKIFEHLRKLASQKQCLVTSTPKGNLLFTRANVEAEPVGIIEEASVNSSLRYEVTFDGRKRFSKYRVTCQTPKKKEKKVAVSTDKNVPIMRFKNFIVQNVTAGNIQETADWFRSKQFASALTLPFPVPSWYDPNGDLWKENTTVIVKSKTLGVPDGYKFLIRSVEFKFSDQGLDAVLGLVPPETYTGGEIKEPWIKS